MKSLEATADVNIRSGPGAGFEIYDALNKGDVIEEIDIAGWCPIKLEDGQIAWVSRKFLVEAKELPPKPPVSGEPIWLRWARSKLGLREVPGPSDNPEIAAWYKLTTLPREYWHDSTAWCAVFVNAAFELNNLPGTSDARAVSWLEYGEEVDEPEKGDIVIFDWGNGGHHVNFFLKYADADGYITCLGGNQSDGVTISDYPIDAVMGYRHPA